MNSVGGSVGKTQWDKEQAEGSPGVAPVKIVVPVRVDRWKPIRNSRCSARVCCV